MNSKDIKSTKELKQDVLDGIHQLKDDIDEIGRKFTPGQLIDDVLFTSTENNPRVVFERLQSNPIGSTFLGLGTILLMEDNFHGSFESRMRRRSSSTIDHSREQFNSLKMKKDELTEKVSRIFDQTKTKVSELPGKAEIQQGISDSIQSKVDTIKNFDPMTIAALGAGLGALTGFSLPVSDKENSFITQSAGEGISKFSTEFQDAINKSVQILKEQVMGKFKDFNSGLFQSKSGSDENVPDVPREF